MKKATIKRILAGACAVAVAVLAPLSAVAAERSYSYIYDYWGESLRKSKNI